MSTHDPSGLINEINHAASHLRDYVVEHGQIAFDDVLAYARLHTSIEESSYPILVDRLHDLGVQITNLEAYQESIVAEELEAREEGFIRDNSQIYMVDLSKLELLDREKEILFAQQMNQSMSQVLALLVRTHPIADQVNSWFNQYRTIGQLSGVVAGELIDHTTHNGNTQERPVKSKKEELSVSYDKTVERITNFQSAFNKHYKVDEAERTQATLDALIKSFCYFRFTTNRYDELLGIFDQINETFDTAFSRIEEILTNAGCLQEDERTTLLAGLDQQRIEEWVAKSQPESHSLIDYCYELERLRHTVKRVARDCGLAPAALSRLSLDVKKARGHYNDALENLVEGNLRLVIAVAQNYQNQGVPLLDLVQEGNVGLIRAARKFDYTRGFRFSTYATWWIREAVLKAVNDLPRTVHLPQKLLQSIRVVTRVQSLLTQQLGRDPTVNEIASKSGLSTKQVREVITYGQNAVSVETPVGDEDSDQTLVDLLVSDHIPTPEQEAAMAGLRHAVELSLTDLTAREAQILTLKFGIGRYDEMSIREISQELGISPDRVRQITGNALRRLKTPQFASLLEPYL